MADIEALMYSYPSQGQPGFTALLAQREEFWPTTYDVQRAASQEAGGGGSPPESPKSSSSDIEESAEASSPLTVSSSLPVRNDPLEMTDENVARRAVRVLCQRFMLTYDRLFLYYNTGAGKTVISSGATEPLVRDVATEFVDSYLYPRRTNLQRIIVIVSSDAQKRDFMKKIIETSSKTEYQRAVRVGMKQPLLERLATYAAALSPTYVFFTKTEFLTSIYGTSSTHSDIDPKQPDPSALAFANNSIILIDEIHSFSREDTASRSVGIKTGTEEEEDQSPKVTREDEDIRYNQYHYVLHAIRGSKVIGMSATPMKDSPQEIIKVMNLILPLDHQIPAGLDVLSRETLLPYLRGYISYFRTRSTRVMNRGVMMSLNSGDGAEFEVIFPVAMSEFQAKVYTRVVSERDAFNRNALRAGNTVYPDEESGHSGFIARFVKNARGWDGMEPTDEYRAFLRESRANREMLSPKFCRIADICKISRGVVFVYMRNLESGLLDLAAFLDAEGFERFTPGASLFIQRTDGGNEMLIPRKPRYSLVIGETKTVPGRLDGILSLANIDENADGEYLKIVLGSAAVRESFDIRNSITMIIASPEQTETAMLQALGRIVRPGAQRALLRKFPELPPIVSVYRLASYLPGTQYEGKDVDTYLESARKDRRIKVVERMLRDASVDCRMLHSLNYDEMDDVVDDSPACLYGPCDYVCDMSEKESTPDPAGGPAADHAGGPARMLDSTSMNALYQEEKLLRLRSEIQKAAKRHTYIPIADIDAVVESHALAQRVIETMSMTKQLVRDRFGRQSYLYHDRNGIFFAASPVITGRVGDGSGDICPVSMSDYEHYITTSLITPLDTSLLLPGILETILVVTPKRAVTESLQADHDLLVRFSRYLRREIVPKSALLEHVRVRGEQRVKDLAGNKIYWVDYSGLLYSRGDLRVYEGDEGISPLIDKSSSGLPLRILETPTGSSADESPASWETPGAVLMRLLHHRWSSYMKELFAPYEKRFEFYAVIRPSEPNILRIVRRGGRDNAKTPGRALSSWSSDDLRGVMISLFGSDRQAVSADRLSAREFSEYLKREFHVRGRLLNL